MASVFDGDERAEWEVRDDPPCLVGHLDLVTQLQDAEADLIGGELAGTSGGKRAGRRFIRKLGSFFVSNLDVIVDVKEVSWHRAVSMHSSVETDHTG